MPNSSFSRYVIPAFSVLLPSMASADMVAMGDNSLAAVAGQSGISIGIELDINVQDMNGDGVVDLTGNNFTPISGCGTGNYDDGSFLTCTLALSFANRANEWLVIKDYYGSMRVDNLFLDAGYLVDAGNDPTTYAPGKFLDSDGSTCLIDPTGNNCGSSGVPPSYFDDLAGLMIRAPGSRDAAGNFTAPTYNPTSRQSDGYDSLRLGLSIGGMAVEYGATGHSQNVNGSFLGLKIADNNSPYAGADIQGQAYLFGF
ncbi:DUF6160 family protein [Alcanivorax sp. MD8A]|uniref:DUF6160 family protein n=1 Tax=Alcanivorax sp. MD8A TaxID=1177157 RepID=UPI0011AF2510|nr:DUF6160 family protein [Alcanivorax sp. MD8A]